MRIALVEYLNTFPFSQGMKSTGFDQQHEVYAVIPSQCAALFREHAVDVSLCPVGALPEMPDHELVGRYCIGANGPVKTVMLLSRVPLEAIKTVLLDSHSRTSNLLLQVLAMRHWKKSWTYVDQHANGSMETCLMIGDKVFENSDAYPYQYDLAEAWKALTGLPMVFAVWIAHPDVRRDVIKGIDTAFENGMSLVEDGKAGLAVWQTEYLTQSISYEFDEAKRSALKLFTEWASALHSPGTIR